MQPEIKYLRWEANNIVTTDVRASPMLVLRFGETLENTMKEWLDTLGMKCIKDFMQLRHRVKKVKGKKRYRHAYKYADLISVLFINK
jgi:hypothetical protein